MAGKPSRTLTRATRDWAFMQQICRPNNWQWDTKLASASFGSRNNDGRARITRWSWNKEFTDRWFSIYDFLQLSVGGERPWRIEWTGYGRLYVAAPSLFALSAFSIASISYPANRNSKAGWCA